MPTPAPSNGEDYPKAAGKHLDDALTLLGRERPDNAGYLAGYVVECVMKTLIGLETGGKLMTHDLRSLSRRAGELAALPGARTASYAFSLTVSHEIFDYDGPGWNESLRYRPVGTVPMDKARSWVAEAERAYERAIVTARLDGVLD